MAHIYVYSPSGAVRDKAAFRRGVARLKALGHEVQVDQAALLSAQRFAGDDSTRLQAIARAAASGADVTLISRGGYGLSRLLSDLPYKAIERSVQRGMLWVGTSDFTVLQAAVYASSGAVTWAGPALAADFGCADQAEGHDNAPDDIMESCFSDAVQGVGEGVGWSMPLRDVPYLSGALTPHAGRQSWSTQGRLWGGNLAMLTSLLGTPYLPCVERGVLWFEDVAEHPYRLERMLLQWLHAGVLHKQRAIVLGQFTHYKLTPHDKGFAMNTVVEKLRSLLKIPVLTGLPFGHVPTKVLLPFGQHTRLIVEGREAMLFWG